MTDQAESGASTVVIRKTMQQCIDELRRSEHSAGMVANWLEPLTADLKCVTAELENGKLALHVTTCWNNSLEARLMQAEAERDAMREVVTEAREYAFNGHVQACRYEYRNCTCGYDDINGALRRLDATRKATADAAEVSDDRPQSPNRPLTGPTAHGSRENDHQGTETEKGRSGAVSDQ